MTPYRFLAIFSLIASAALAPAQTPTSDLNTRLANSANLGTVIPFASPDQFTPAFSRTVSAYLNSSPRTLQNTGGTLVYSDDPETVNSAGILYQTSVPAEDVRTYLYHVNGFAPGGAKCTVVLENQGATSANINFTRKVQPTASGNYILVGKTATEQFYTNTAVPSPLSLPPATPQLMDSALDSTSIASGALLHTIHDFTTDQPLTVTVLMLSSGTNTLSTFASQPFSPNDGLNRQGTFPTYTRENITPIDYNVSQNIRWVRVADGPTFNVDPFVVGTDAEANVSRSLKGNFGVNYKIRLNLTGDGSRNVALLLNPRAGGYAGYVRVSTPGLPGGTGRMVPASSTVSSSSEAVPVARFNLLASARTAVIELMPAGASSLPIEFALVPYTGTADIAMPVDLSLVSAE